MFGGTAANRDKCQAQKETHKQGSCALYMTHFKLSVVNPNVNSVSQKDTPHYSLISSTELPLSQPPATSVFLQQPQTGKGIYSLNLTQTAHSQTKPLSSSSTSIFLMSTVVSSATWDRQKLPLSQPPATYWWEENTLSLKHNQCLSHPHSLFFSETPTTATSSTFPIPHPPLRHQGPPILKKSFQGSEFFPGFLSNPSIFDMILVCFVWYIWMI